MLSVPGQNPAVHHGFGAVPGGAPVYRFRGFFAAGDTQYRLIPLSISPMEYCGASIKGGASSGRFLRDFQEMWSWGEHWVEYASNIPPYPAHLRGRTIGDSQRGSDVLCEGAPKVMGVLVVAGFDLG